MKLSKYIPFFIVLLLAVTVLAAPSFAADHSPIAAFALPPEVQKSLDNFFNLINDAYIYVMQKRYIVGAFSLTIAVMIWVFSKLFGAGREAGGIIRGAIFACLILGFLPSIVGLFVNVGN